MNPVSGYVNFDKKIVDVFNTAQNIVVIPHFNPDGDAIGSALGMAYILRELGKNAQIVSPNNYSSFLAWMPGVSDIVIASEEFELAKKIINESDLIVCVDFNMPDRMNILESVVLESGIEILLIDHHPNPKPFYNYLVQNEKASAAAEMVFELIEYLDWKKHITKDIATSLFTAIMTDTGSFSYSTSNPNTFRVVSELMQYDLDTDHIYNMVYNNFSSQRMNLLGYTLHQKMVILPEYNTGYISLTTKELEQFDFQSGDTEGFVNYPLSVKGVKVSAIFIEKEKHVKISFRSKGTFPVNLFSKKHFNGGGHVNAAGGESYDNLENTVNRFKELLKEYKKELNA